MIKFKLLAGVALATIAISSCEEETLNIGSSLTYEGDKVSATSTTFNVATRTIIADSVLSLSNKCYLGKVKDPETGANVTSDFSTQFNLYEHFYLPLEDSIVSRYDGKVAADSCDIILYLKNQFLPNDSLLAMKMNVKEMGTPAEEGIRYYSNFDPIAHGLIRTDGIDKSKMFTYANLADKDSLRKKSTYLNNICISLKEPYTDKAGNQYNNYGTYLLQSYYKHPEYFKNSYTFIHNVCPGFFFKITDGFGFHALVSDMGIRIYYRANHNDSIYNSIFTLAGTKEVLQTTHVTNDMAAIRALADDNTCTYLKTPAGLFTEATLPVDEIRANHTTDSLVAAKLTLQRLNYNSSDKRSLGIPSTLLMVEKDSLTNFFEKNSIPDGKQAFYAVYASSTNTYTFSNISNLITRLWENKQNGMNADPNWVAKHPNWNKVVLVPISLTVNSTTSTVTNCEHDMSLTSTRLVGGSANPNAPVQINIVYAKFKQ